MILYFDKKMSTLMAINVDPLQQQKKKLFFFFINIAHFSNLLYICSR
jgi:hypothetical protein